MLWHDGSLELQYVWSPYYQLTTTRFHETLDNITGNVQLNYRSKSVQKSFNLYGIDGPEKDQSGSCIVLKSDPSELTCTRSSTSLDPLLSPFLKRMLLSVYKYVIF